MAKSRVCMHGRIRIMHILMVASRFVKDRRNSHANKKKTIWACYVHDDYCSRSMDRASMQVHEGVGWNQQRFCDRRASVVQSCIDFTCPQIPYVTSTCPGDGCGIFISGECALCAAERKLTAKCHPLCNRSGENPLDPGYSNCLGQPLPAICAVAEAVQENDSGRVCFLGIDDDVLWVL
jgi:hypothetical protein